jgi:hypothetical protein
MQPWSQPLLWKGSAPSGLLYPIFIYAGGGVAGDKITANFGATAFVGAVPSGFASFAPAGTWNPADCSASITLSGGNLIATTTTTAAAGVRGNIATSTGKYYCEYTFTTVNTNSTEVGFGKSSAVLSSGSSVGIAWINRTGPITINNVGTGVSLGTISVGGTVSVAIDCTAKLIWFRIAPSGNWNNSGTANPAAGVGGFDISSIM